RELLERLHVVARPPVAHALRADELRGGVHRAQREVRAAGGAPGLELGAPGVGPGAVVDGRLGAEAREVAALLREQLLHLLPLRAHAAARRAELEAVARARGAPEGRGHEAPEPDRDRALRQRERPGAVDAVERPAEVDHRLGPEPAQERHLLLEPRAARRVVDAERLVLDVVPARADAEA